MEGGKYVYTSLLYCKVFFKTSCKVMAIVPLEYGFPHPPDPLNSLLQYQVVPVRQRTLLAKQFLFPLLQLPTDMWYPQSQGQTTRDHPLVNPVIVQPQLPPHLSKSPHTPQKTLLALSRPKSPLPRFLLVEKGPLMSENHLSSIYPTLNHTQFILRIPQPWQWKFCSKVDISF